MKTKQGKNWIAYNDDCVEVCRQLPSDSIDLTISSFPFANLYTYSDDIRDFSNVKDLDEYFRQLDYLIPELYRITKPGRLICLMIGWKKSSNKSAIMGFILLMVTHKEEMNYIFQLEDVVVS